MTLCMGVMPLAVTLGIVKAVWPYVESWSTEVFGAVFAVTQVGLFIFGAWLYVRWIGD